LIVDFRKKILYNVSRKKEKEKCIMKEKMTKKEYYALLKETVTNSEVENKEMLLEFIDSQVAVIDNKAEKAKAKAAEKKAAGDELREVVQSILTSEYQTGEEITAQIDGEDISKAKVVARLSQLVKAGIATKTDVKTEDSKTVKAYKLVD
jgi:hypothetical protein